MVRTVLVLVVVCFVSLSAIIPPAASHLAMSPSQGDSSALFSVSVTNRLYLTGEAIGIRLELVNPTLSDLYLGYVGGPWIDYEILSNGAVLYRWSDDKVFTAEVRKLTMAPLEVREFSFVHTGADYPLSPGVYQVRGVFVNRAEAYASLIVVDVLPGLVLRALSVTLGAGLVVILVSATGYALTRRRASKRGRHHSLPKTNEAT